MLRPSLIALLFVFTSMAPVIADTVYFVSRSTGSLYTFDSAVGAITALTGTSTFPDASALAMGADGNLYVGDSTGGGSIKRYVIATGSVSTVMSLNGSGPAFPGSPVNPGAIAFAPNGTMLVGRNPAVAFFPGGVAAWPGGSVLGVTGWRDGETPAVSAFTSGTSQDYSPGLAVAPDGSLYVSNSFYNATTFVMTGNVLKFNASGAFQAAVAADGSATGGLSGPAGLAVSGNSLFTASTMNGNVYKTDLTNSNTATNTSLFASTGGDFLGPLALLASGNLLAGSVSGPAGLIYQFDPTGTQLTPFGGAEYGQIGGVAVAPVPEPGTVVLAAVGIVAAACRLRHRNVGRS
jgi:sugar lactone lactonase YvrE